MRARRKTLQIELSAERHEAHPLKPPAVEPALAAAHEDELLPLGIDDGRDEPPAERELLLEGRRDPLACRRGDADRVVRGVLGEPRRAVAGQDGDVRYPRA